MHIGNPEHWVHSTSIIWLQSQHLQNDPGAFIVSCSSDSQAFPSTPIIKPYLCMYHGSWTPCRIFGRTGSSESLFRCHCSCSMLTVVCVFCWLLHSDERQRRSDVWCSFSYVPLLLMHILARTNIDSSFAHATIRANCHYNDWWVCIKHGWLLWIKRIRYDFPYLRRNTLCEAQLSIVCLMNLPLWLVARLLSD